FAAKDIIAVSARQRVIEVAAKEAIGSARSHFVDGARGLAVDHIGGPLPGRSHDDVTVSIAIDVAGACNRSSQMGLNLEPRIAFAGRAVDAEPVGRAEIGDVDIAKSGSLAENDVGRASVRIAVRVRVRRPNDQVIKAVAIEITGRGNGVPEFVSDRGAVDAEA